MKQAAEAIREINIWGPIFKEHDHFKNVRGTELEREDSTQYLDRHSQAVRKSIRRLNITDSTEIIRPLRKNDPARYLEQGFAKDHIF